MDLNYLLELCEYRIASGDPYGWTCYPNGWNLNLELDVIERENVSCVFNTKTREIYEIVLPFNNKWFIWRNPAYIDAYESECEDGGYHPDHIYDEVYGERTDLLSFITLLIGAIEQRNKNEQDDTDY